MTPVQPVPGAQPGVVPGQFPAAQVPTVTPVSAPAKPVSAPAGKDDRVGRSGAPAGLLPLAVAAGACLLLAAIGLLVFLATSGDGEGPGNETASGQRQERRSTSLPASKEPTFRPQPKRRVVEGIDSALGELPVDFDDDEVFAQAGPNNAVDMGGQLKPLVADDSDDVARVDGGNVFADRMPDADDLELDGTDSVDEAEEATETPEEEAEEEPVERPEPFTEMPDRVSLPRLPASADQAAAVPIGVVHKLESDDVTFALGGASEALGSKGSFGVQREDEPSAARVLVQRAGSGGGKQVLPVARLAVENEQLTFQWLADDAMPEAECLSNCSLVVTVADQSKALRLREPEVVAPLKIDVLKTGASFKKRLKAMPSSSSLGLEIIELSDAFPDHAFVGGPRLQPSTKKVIKLKSTSGQEMLSLHVNFLAKRGGEISIVAKPIGTDGQVFQLQKALAQAPALQNQKQLLQAQYQAFRGAARTAAKPRFDRQMEAMDLKIAHFMELEDVCQQIRGGGAMHFRVFLDVGGREIDLLTTKPDAQAGTDATGLFSEAVKDAEEKPPVAKEAAKE